MKTGQKGKAFAPISITLETEDEAKILYVLLADSTTYKINELLEENNLKLSKDLREIDVAFSMYNSLLDVYEPE
jgi:hypothetical protein